MMRSAIAFTLGVFLTAALMTALGAWHSSDITPGRFQLSVTPAPPGGGPYAFVIDTATGQVWSNVPPGDHSFIDKKLPASQP